MSRNSNGCSLHLSSECSQAFCCKSTAWGTARMSTRAFLRWLPLDSESFSFTSFSKKTSTRGFRLSAQICSPWSFTQRIRLCGWNTAGAGSCPAHSCLIAVRSFRGSREVSHLMFYPFLCGKKWRFYLRGRTHISFKFRLINRSSGSFCSFLTISFSFSTSFPIRIMYILQMNFGSSM